MTICEKFIEKIITNLPEVCEAKDLIRAGLFRSRQEAAMYRESKEGPPFFKLGPRIIYPRTGIAEWLRKNKQELDEKAPEDQD